MDSPVIELFLDRERISWEHNLERRLCQPQKHRGNPVLKSEHPWEELYTIMHGNVMPREDGSGYRMWYVAGAKGMQKCQFLCYAESEDGFNWQRVMDSRNPYEGCAETNILAGLQHNIHGPHVIRNEHNDDPQQRYLMFFDSYPNTRPEMANRHQNGRCCYTMTSPDGLLWSPEAGRFAVHGKSDTGQSVVWDPRRRRYIAYMRGIRPHKELQPFASPWGEHVRVRYVRAAVSHDFEHWSDSIEILRAEPDENDPYNHIHQIAVTRRGDQFIGLRSMFRIDGYKYVDYEDKGQLLIEEGPCETQLAISRDGLHWRPVADRAVFLPRGGENDWDRRWIVTPGQFIVEKERMLFYYGGHSRPRTKSPRMKGESKNSVGVASLPRDRFQSLRPRLLHQPAVVETKPMYLSEGDLRLNADASNGEVRVELLTFHGLPIEGFTRQDCQPITTDNLDHVVRWRGGRLSDAVDSIDFHRHAIRIAIYLDHAAQLYAAYLPPCRDPLESD